MLYLENCPWKGVGGVTLLFYSFAALLFPSRVVGQKIFQAN